MKLIYFCFKEEIAQKFGLYKEHFYLISEVFSSDKTNFIKIHNPFNTKEKIKNSEKNIQLEAKLKQLGVSPSAEGEFW